MADLGEACPRCRGAALVAVVDRTGVYMVGRGCSSCGSAWYIDDIAESLPLASEAPRLTVPELIEIRRAHANAKEAAHG